MSHCTPRKDPNVIVGSNLHYRSDGKPLCTFSEKLCQQHRMEGYGYCIRHILEDRTAPFSRCQFVSKQTSKQCTNAVPIQQEDNRYCSAHKRMLGIRPSKVKRKRDSKDSVNREITRQRKLKFARILKTYGIEHSPKLCDFHSSIIAQYKDGNGAKDQDASTSSDEDTSIDESELLSTATLRVDDFLPFQVSMDHFTAEDVAEQCCYKLETLMALYDCQFQRLRNTLKNKLWKSQGSVATVIEKPDRKAQHVRLYRRLLRKQLSNQELEEETHSLDKREHTQCAFESSGQRCRGRCIIPTRYCFAHIVHDRKQKLFQTCTYELSPHNRCSYPVLKSTSPSLCHGHLDSKSTTKQARPKKPAGKIQNPCSIDSSNASDFSIGEVEGKLNELIKKIQTKRKKLHLQALRQERDTNTKQSV